MLFVLAPTPSFSSAVEVRINSHFFQFTKNIDIMDKKDIFTVNCNYFDGYEEVNRTNRLESSLIAC